MATVTCPGCQERDERIATLERRVAELDATVRDLTARLGTNATNSCTPPSAAPPPRPPQAGRQEGHRQKARRTARPPRTPQASLATRPSPPRHPLRPHA